MKRIYSVVVAGAVVCGLFAGCAGQQETTAPSQTTQATQSTTTAPNQTEGPAYAVEALEAVWNLFAEEEKFWVIGGDHAHSVDNAPGAVKLSNTDFLTTSLLVPQAQLESITEAASMMHAMNGNNFTCGVYKVNDVNSFAEAMQTAIENHQWLCGMPQQLKILDLGEGYVLVAFGIDDAMDPFFRKLATAHPQAVTLVDEPIV